MLSNSCLTPLCNFQFNAHVENVTVIAKRIPTGSVINHMYFKLLREALTVTETAGTPSSDQFKMIAAIHRVIPSRISYEAIAASLLMMFVNPPTKGASSDDNNRVERLRLVKRLRGIIRAIALELRPSFDGCLLLESLLSFDVSSDSWSIRDEEDKARLINEIKEDFKAGLRGIKRLPMEAKLGVIPLTPIIVGCLLDWNARLLRK